MKRSLTQLGIEEVVALAIASEEEDSRIYEDFAARLRETHPDTARMLDEMAAEERGHAASLIALYRERFGDHIPLVRREDVRGFLKRKPLWLARVLDARQVRDEVASMEEEAMRFYRLASSRATDLRVRSLFNELAATEETHKEKASDLRAKNRQSGAEEAEDNSARRRFVLQIIQPALAGLMDGSVSTLAPVFAAAYATKDSWDAFVVGLASSVGAGISMGFAEALSDDGVISGRGNPWARGLVCGLMTTLGGIGHTVPFLIPEFHVAMAVAIAVVVVELAAISWIRHKYMDTPLLQAAFQVVVGGVLVLIAGILIGSA